jgi:hypothetical protein
MSTKPNKPEAPATPISRCKIQEAHRHLWHAMNLLKLSELAANEVVDGEIQGDDDYLHGIVSASVSATESIRTAYVLIDQFDSFVAEGDA